MRVYCPLLSGRHVVCHFTTFGVCQAILATGAIWCLLNCLIVLIYALGWTNDLRQCLDVGLGDTAFALAAGLVAVVLSLLLVGMMLHRLLSALASVEEARSSSSGRAARSARMRALRRLGPCPLCRSGDSVGALASRVPGLEPRGSSAVVRPDTPRPASLVPWEDSQETLLPSAGGSWGAYYRSMSEGHLVYVGPLLDPAASIQSTPDILRPERSKSSLLYFLSSSTRPPRREDTVA